MITGNEELLIIEMQCLHISMQAKRRVQTGMRKEENDKLTMAIEALIELENYYIKNRLT
jgi:hypothetical protein